MNPPMVPDLSRAALEKLARDMAAGRKLNRSTARAVGLAILGFLEGFDATVRAWKHLDRGLDIPRYTAMVAKQAKRKHDGGK